MFASKTSKRNTLILKRPASVEKSIWKTGLPIGNGLTGALIPGATTEERVILTHHDLWHSLKGYSELPDVTDSFAEMRRLIDEKDYLSASMLMCNAISTRGYQQTEGPTPFPLAAMYLNYIHNGIFFKHYRRGIDMEDGTAFVEWEDEQGKHLRRFFVSRDNDILYCHIHTQSKCCYTIQIDMYDNIDGDSRNERILRQPSENHGHGTDSLWYTANTDGSDFGAILKVVLHDTSEKCSVDDSGALNFESADFTILITTFSREAKEIALSRLTDKLNSAPSFEQALLRHSKLHSDLFNRINIELTPDSDENLTLSNEELLDQAYENTAPVALYEKIWRFGRYLFISGSCPGSNPFPLYGLWPGTYNLPWNSNVCNENVEMIHWHTLAGGLSYAIENLIDYYFDKIPECKENAKKLFGCHGIYVPAYTSPATLDGKNLTPPTPIVPVTVNWISGAGWLSQHFYEYYRYTKNTELLNKKILPFMLETARFYEDYVVFDKNGKCRIYPSVSPENTPGNMMPPDYIEKMGHICPVSENATMDFAIMKALFQNLFELLGEKGVICPVPDETIEKWKQIYHSIPDYMTNKDGALKEWMHPDLEDNYNHRHFSHLYPLFPGNEISLESDEKNLSPFRKATELRLVKSQSGWSFAHQANILIRLGEGERAIHCIDTMAKSCLLDNFFTLHNDWRHMGASMVIDHMTPVQLDALMGTVNAIQEMVFQYHTGVLMILPALPMSISYVIADNLYFPEGNISIRLHDKHINITVTATEDCKLTLSLPDRNKIDFSLTQGQTKIFQI